jgi:hypothetical protein
LLTRSLCEVRIAASIDQTHKTSTLDFVSQELTHCVHSSPSFRAIAKLAAIPAITVNSGETVAAETRAGEHGKTSGTVAQTFCAVCPDGSGEILAIIRTVHSRSFAWMRCNRPVGASGRTWKGTSLAQKTFQNLSFSLPKPAPFLGQVSFQRWVCPHPVVSFTEQILWKDHLTCQKFPAAVV